MRKWVKIVFRTIYWMKNTDIIRVDIFVKHSDIVRVVW